MSSIATKAFFLPGALGHRFCLLHVPTARADVCRTMVYVHPFAEEMNKSRHAVAVAARALASRGWAILQVDLLGCGDSSGEFGDASWQAWLDDVAASYHWLEGRFGIPPALWGLRLGCLLIAQSIARLGASPDLFLWQPVLSGRVQLTQFLRLKVAGDALADPTARAHTKTLREQIARGETVEIAGYALTEALARPMDAAEFDLPDHYPGQVRWWEVSTAKGAGLAPASQSLIAALSMRGVSIEAASVTGLPFWQTQEIAECPALVDALLQPRERMSV